MSKFDIHTHHYRCGHAYGEIAEYIEAAIAAGMTAIGISDHSPYFASHEDQPHPGIAMAKSEFSAYIDEVLRMKAVYADKIDVLLGVESDFFPDHIDLYRNMYRQFPFDYIIGSVHHVKGVSIFNRTRWRNLDDEQQIAEKKHYYELIGQSAASGVFQILGHIDAMKGYYPQFSDIPDHGMIDRTLQTIAEHEVAIEINTSGKTKKCGGWYPSDAILERACHFGVDVTFGSDSHKPERVGEEWEEVQQRLKEIGFKHWVYFKEKKKTVVPIP